MRSARQMHDAEQRDQHAGADQAELLAGDGEDEVGVLLGHEAGPGLRAVEEPLAEQPAVADRDPRLLGVVAGAARVEVGVGERQEPVDLVVLEQPRRSPPTAAAATPPATSSASQRRGRTRRRRARRRRSRTSTSMVPRSGCSRISAAGMPAISEHQPTTSTQPTRRRRRALGALGDDQRHPDHDGQLGELRGLDGQPAEHQPRARAVDGRCPWSAPAPGRPTEAR